MKAVILAVALTFTLVTLTTGQGRPRGGDDDDDDDRRPGMGRPRPQACDPQTITQLNETVRNILAGVLANTSDIEQILPYLRYLPLACARLLREKFEDKTCDAAAAVNAICEGNTEVGRTVLSCLSEQNLCTVISTLLSERPECLTMRLREFLTRQSLDAGCSISNLRPCDILTLPKDRLGEHLRSLDAGKIVKFLTEADARFIKLLPCDVIKLVARIVAEKDIFDFSTLSIQGDLDQLRELLPLLPLLPESVCEAIPVGKISLFLEDLKDLDYMCGEKPNPRDVARKLRERMDSGDTDDSSDRRQPRPSLCDVSDADIGQIREWIESNIGSQYCEFKCGPALLKTLLDNGAINISLPEHRERIGNLAECISVRKLIEAAQPGQCQDFPPESIPDGGRAAEQLAKRCRPLKDFANFTADDIKGQGCIFLQERGVDEVPKDAICSALGELSECIRETNRRKPEIVRQLGKACERLTPEALQNLGPAAIQAPCEALQELTEGEMEAAIGDFCQGLKDMRESGQRGVRGSANCLKPDELNLNSIVECEEILETLSEKRFKAKLRGKNIKEILGLTTGKEPSLPKHLRKAAFEALREQKPIKDLTAEDFRDMVSLVTGISATDIGDLPRGDRLPILLILCNYDSWQGNQIPNIGDGIVEALSDLNPDDPLAEFTSSMAENMDKKCLQGLGDRVGNLTEKVCAAVCERLGDSPELSCVYSLELRNRLTNICLQCSGAGDGSLEEQHVAALGQMVVDADREVLDRIPGSLFKRFARMLTRFRCMKKDVADFIQEKINSVISGTSTLEDLEDLGAWVTGLPEDKRLALKDKLTELVNREEIGRGLAEDGESDCCRRAFSDAENTEIEQGLKSRREVLKEIVAAESSASRKRRNTKQYTCGELETLGTEGLSALTVDEIGAITVEEFDYCLQLLGSKGDWSEEQLMALWDRFTALIQQGNVELCDLTTEHLQRIGTIGYKIPVETIKCLSLTTDSLNQLAALSRWSQEQKEAFVKRYLSQNNKVGAGSLTAEDLKLLRHFVCGLTAEEIGQIPPAVFSEATSAVRDLETCGQAQLEALAQLAVHSDVHGPVSGWGSQQFADLGIVIAGLTAEDLNKADMEDVEGWTDSAIKLLSDDRKKSLSADVRSYMSYEQSLAAGFSDDGNNGNGNNGTSGACVLEMSIFTLLTIIIAQV